VGSSRANRVPERIKEILAELVGQLKDPRIGFVTITDVRTTADFGHATAYYTVLPTGRGRSGQDAGNNTQVQPPRSSPATPERSLDAVLDDGDTEVRERTAEGLASATPLLRRELGHRLRLRQVPTLEFVHDPVPERGRRIEALIREARRGVADPGSVNNAADQRSDDFADPGSAKHAADRLRRTRDS
jgi:ribosome-binding factor A